MSFDTQTRNRLAAFVGKCRKLLCGDFKTPGGEMARLLAHYGIQDTGTCFAVDELTHLDEPGRETARTLRAILEHKQSTAPKAKVWKKFDPAVYDLIQEQGFTVLNRLCALRMAEERQLVFPCVSKGLQSDGFQLYEYHTGRANAEITPELRYQHFLFSLFDELSLDLGSLFDRFSPQGLLFPGTQALDELLEELNHPELAALWGEDETIGWIYQYWNSQEERKAMRDASAAPRNSRELAVRNQFFTPRYVVQFLSENTLGRTWYEMSQGNTALKENCTYLVRRPSEVFLAEGQEAPEQACSDSEQLSQAEQLKQPVYIPFRPLKDPREIRLLDPACGSMHFGLYAFDLFETIYSEAWDLAQSDSVESGADPSFSNFKLQTSNFSSKEAFLREVPRLIIEHNIHGVDIDPRATQIAGLALWLRAQRTWKNQKVSATERPKVKRSNIVCAEPMPGDQDQLTEFTAKLHPAIAQMVAHIFEKMQLAGEAGSLLKIEEEITALVDEAKAAWQKIGKHEGEMFSMAEIVNADGRSGTQQILDTGDWNVSTLSSISHRDFFEKAESEIYAQLARYAEIAGSASYKRKLFANDAAHGFAFIDLCSKRYEAVVMNPPFGASSTRTSAYMKKIYGNASSDLYASFVCRALMLTQTTNGRVGAITNRTGFFIDQLSDWRESLIDKIDLIADLGSGVLDALVEAAAYTLDSRDGLKSDSSLAFELLATSEKAEPLNKAIQAVRIGQQNACCFQWFATKLQSVPGAPLAYWIHNDLLSIIQDTNSLDTAGFDAQIGVSTKDDFRFLRLRWEVFQGEISKQWFTLAKGGEYARYWSDLHLVINFRNSAQELDAYIAHKYPYLKGNTKWVIHPESGYLRPGLTYTRRTSSPISIRVLPSGSVFSDMGRGIIQDTDNKDTLLSLLGISNTRTFRYFLELCVAAGDAAARTYEGGIVNQMPVCLGTNAISKTVQNLVSVKRSIVSAMENTALFFIPIPCLPAPIQGEMSVTLQRELEAEVMTNFGLCEEARLEIDKRIPEEGHIEDFSELLSGVPALDGIPSYCLGSIFGRWDIRYATGSRQPPELTSPFASLPICPPGMLQNESGGPLSNVELRKLNDAGLYPVSITIDGILVDDADQAEDIVRRVRESFQAIWSDKAEAIEQEACDILKVKELRSYFAEGKAGGKFFKDHLKCYSKSRRKAPIYWPISTESGTYTLWLYYHRLSANTLYTAVTQFIEPKQEEAKETFAKLNAKADRSKAEDKELEAAQLLVAELATFRESLLEIAKFWKPDLNDGVQITAAPLWKHFRLKSWQKTLKGTWSKLEHGDYDWAHLSHSIWPERVINKCITDRSIAIAHGHDEALWVEVTDAKGKSKWQARQNAEDIAEELINTLKQ